MDLVQVFTEEATDHLSNMETALLALENGENVEQCVKEIFRAMHTIKGSAGLVGFDHISYFTHHVESFLDQVRSGTITFDVAMVGVLLDVKDHIEDLIENDADTQAMTKSESIIAHIHQWTQTTPDSKAEDESIVSAPEASISGVWKVLIRPHGETFTDGFDCLPVMRELCENNEHALAVDVLQSDIDAFDPTKCYLSFTLLLDGSVDRGFIDDAFMFVADDWHIDIEKIPLEDNVRLGDLLIDLGKVSGDSIDSNVNAVPKVGEVLKRAGLATQDNIEQTLAQQQFLKQQQQKQNTASVSNIKVPADKLDKLMNLVGELVIVQSSVERFAQDAEDPSLNAISEELSRLTTEVRDTAFGIRMLPIGTTFSRFRRLIRDLNQSLDKEVNLLTQGAETEIDKFVLEKLSDPLVHILRNSMDHGIESPKERLAAGKPSQGTITLSASHKDGNVCISIQDDGNGLDTERILDKAISAGVVSKDNLLSEKDIHQLIFAAGFSTASQVSDVSGRGVGMDVVKTSIESLQGSISVESERGVGTNITLYLPLTMAIIDGLMVRVNQEHFIIPLNIVDECIETQALGVFSDDGAHLVRSRGEVIPATRIRDSFQLDGTAPSLEQTVITAFSQYKFGLTVDEVVGQHQTVIKNLGKFYQNIQGLMGGTILGDGEVAMIIDPSQLYESIQKSLNQLYDQENSNVS